MHRIQMDSYFFSSSRRRHTRFDCDWSSDVCSSDLAAGDTAVRTAATAARASVRLMLGDNAGAASDAATVPTNFAFRAVYSIENEDYYNFLYWVNANQPYREISVFATFYERYDSSTGDPRVRWRTDPKIPTAEVRYVPWLFPTKYTGRGSPISLSTGPEMRLAAAWV